MATPTVDYYAILEVIPSATQEQIRTAYKKAALRWHPDRVPNDSPERAIRTKKFQQINDAYFTLSDPTRRHDYDATRQWNSSTAGAEDFTDAFDATDTAADEEVPPKPQSKKSGAANFASWFPFGKGNDKSSSSSSSSTKTGERQWSSAFEEMMRDAEMGDETSEPDGRKKTKPNGRFWAIVGGISGFGLGTIVGNLPGGIAGALAGSKLGAIRDTHGKSVYEVFQELPQADKAKVLGELATKIFAQAVSG